MLFTRLTFASLFLLPSAGFGQLSYIIFGAGYSAPVPITVAPGQIVNLFVQGVGASLTERVAATTLPLPTVLAGISVQMTQSATPQSVAVPLLAVRPVSTCLNGALATGSSCGRYTAISFQMPYELAPNCQASIQVCPSSATPFVNDAQLVVSENGVAGGAIDLNPVADQIHLANLCDIDTSTALGCAATPVITHADGTLVSASNPATTGEEIVLYALGLGATNPAVPTGQATPSPAPAAFVSEVNIDNQANAAPSKGIPLSLTACSTTPTCPFTPAFAGLTPGTVGLYQVNFVIPSAPQPTIACGAGITSNLTLTIVGSTSFDGAGICVATSTSGIATTSSTVAAQPPASSDSTVPLDGSFVPNTI